MRKPPVIVSPGSRSARWSGLLLSGLLLLNAEAAEPSRETIKKHRDRSVHVNGAFAAVRLPIKSGVVPWNPVAIAKSPDGEIFAANFTGEIYRLLDTDGDGLEDDARLFADVRRDGLRYPTSLVFRGRELFVATTQEVRVYQDADGDGAAEQSRTFFKGFPFTLHRFDWTFGLCFGPDGWLYLALPTDSYNGEPAPDPEGLRGAIVRIAPDGTRSERFATGLRFPFGMGFNDQGDLFFSDNKGGENRTEEINHAVQGAFYGHATRKYGKGLSVRSPLVKVSHGIGMAGLCFNPAGNDFGGTGGELFAACWGPDWLFDRGSIIRVKLFKQPDGSYRAQEHLFAQEVPKASAVTFGPQGDLYAALFGKEQPGHQPSASPSGSFYRFIPAPWVTPSTPPKLHFPLVKGDVASGKALFDQRCASCHSLGGSEESLGPDLLGIGEMLNKEEALIAIRKPSEGIKSGHETEQITRTSGDIVVGRLLDSTNSDLTLVSMGNIQVRIPRTDIAGQVSLERSLMPEGLTDDLSEQQVNDLLAFLGVRDHRPPWWKAAFNKMREVAWSTFPNVSMKIKLAAVSVPFLVGGTAIWLLRRRRRD